MNFGVLLMLTLRAPFLRIGVSLTSRFDRFPPTFLPPLRVRARRMEVNARACAEREGGAGEDQLAVSSCAPSSHSTSSWPERVIRALVGRGAIASGSRNITRRRCIYWVLAGKVFQVGPIFVIQP